LYLSNPLYISVKFYSFLSAFKRLTPKDVAAVKGLIICSSQPLENSGATHTIDYPRRIFTLKIEYIMLTQIDVQNVQRTNCVLRRNLVRAPQTRSHKKYMIPLMLYTLKWMQRHLRCYFETPTFYQNYLAMTNTAGYRKVVNPSPFDRSPSEVRMLLIIQSPFATSMECRWHGT
jgi:hypothetical protein